MALKLTDLLKKAEAKGINKLDSNIKLLKEVTKPWQEESILYNNVSDVLANSEQSVTDTLANRDKSDSLKQIMCEADVSNTLDKQLANREQIIDDNLNYDTDILVGKERELLHFIFAKCQFIGTLETPAITTEEIKKSLFIKAEHVRNLIFRLSEKGFIKVSKLKNGRAGWRKFTLPQFVFQHLSFKANINDPLAKREQNVIEPLAEPLAWPSSGGNRITNTTNNTIKQSLPQEWDIIDIEPLSTFGFSKTHLWQIIQQGKLSPEMVQDSIHAFAYDLKHNNRGNSTPKGSPLNFFMEILRNGQPYTPPQNYESPQDEATRKYYEYKKAREAKRIKMEQELIEIAFNDWFSELDKQAIADIVPVMYRDKTNDHVAKKAFLREHFKNHEWLTMRDEIFSQRFDK